MNVHSNPENQQRNVTGDTTTIKLVRMELLLELNRGEPGVFTSIVNVACASRGVESQQIRRWFILLNKRLIVDRTTALLKRRLKLNVILRSNV